MSTPSPPLQSATADAAGMKPPPSCEPLSCQTPAATPQYAGPSMQPPNEAQCMEIWRRFEMPPHIQEHSLLVACVAEAIARQASDIGLFDCVQSVRAAALLHDIAKHYTILHGGNHAYLGGVWAMEATGNPAIAQGVVHHVFWPWKLDVDAYFLPLTVIYADKRAKHDRLVGVEERFEDLFERYATNEFIRSRIELSRQQSLDLERALSKRLGMNLDACTFDSGWLVERT